MQTFHRTHRWCGIRVLVGIIATDAYRNVYASDHAARGEANYKRALTYLPELVAANAHLAKLEAAKTDR
jgi:hypothetical protein